MPASIPRLANAPHRCTCEHAVHMYAHASSHEYGATVSGDTHTYLTTLGHFELCAECHTGHPIPPEYLTRQHFLTPEER